MWKKNEPEMGMENVTSAPAMVPMAASSVQTASAARSTIGASLKFVGDLLGEEDLQVLGTLEGTVSLQSSSVTIGKGGSVKGNIFAKTILVDGEVQGDVFGGEQVLVRKTGCVRGNITAPMVSLESGAKLKGTIDMDPAGLEAIAAKNAQRSLRENIERDGSQAAPIGPSIEAGNGARI